MSCSQGLANLFANVECLFQRKYVFRLYDLSKAASLNEGHGDELHSSPFAQVVDAQDMLVGNAAGKQQFLLESLHNVRICHQFGTNDLERHHTIQLKIVGLVNAPHSTFPEFAFNAIAWPKSGTEGKVLEV